MILPADKGRIMVIMYKSEYEKCEQLLKDEKTYKKLKGDPTRKYKMKLGNILKDLKDSKTITPVLWITDQKSYINPTLPNGPIAKDTSGKHIKNI